MEYVVVKVWIGKKSLVIINYYNPCKRLELNRLEGMKGLDKGNVLCGDINAPNELWGSDRNDNNGQVIEELVDERNLVCLNDGNTTRVDLSTNRESVLTYVSYDGIKQFGCSV